MAIIYMPSQTVDQWEARRKIVSENLPPVHPLKKKLLEKVLQQDNRIYQGKGLHSVQETLGQFRKTVEKFQKRSNAAALRRDSPCWRWSLLERENVAKHNWMGRLETMKIWSWQTALVGRAGGNSGGGTVFKKENAYKNNTLLDSAVKSISVFSVSETFTYHSRNSMNNV